MVIALIIAYILLINLFYLLFINIRSIRKDIESLYHMIEYLEKATDDIKLRKINRRID